MLLVVASTSGKGDAGRLADQTAAAVAPDQIACPQGRAIGQCDGDAHVVLRETRQVPAAIDTHGQFVDPPGENALDVLLSQRQPVVVPGRKIADVEARHRESRDLGDLSCREEAVDDSALVQDLERACAQAASTRTGKLLVGAAFDHGHVDASQGQLARQHQARRTCPGNHDGVFFHRRLPWRPLRRRCNRS